MYSETILFKTEKEKEDWVTRYKTLQSYEETLSLQAESNEQADLLAKENE